MRQVDICFIIDIVFNFRTAFYDKQGKLELDHKLISRNYLRSWFFIDLIASVPTDWFNTGTGAIGAAKMPRLLRLGRLLKKFDQFAAASASHTSNSCSTARQ